jgi:NDP-sugar pyrophosphorylase family protein
MDIDAVFEKVRQDTSLLANIDIEELLKNVSNEKHDYLDNKTLGDVLDENISAVKTLGLTKEKMKDVCNRLAGYRYVENLYELHKGKHIRWIRNDNKTLTNGAIVMDVKFLDNGSHILCRNAQHRLFQVKFNECLIFQKLSTGEQLILMAYEHVRETGVSA